MLRKTEVMRKEEEWRKNDELHKLQELRKAVSGFIEVSKAVISENVSRIVLSLHSKVPIPEIT